MISPDLIFLFAGVAVAAVIDVRTRRIPNALTFSLMVVGLLASAMVGPGIGFGLMGFAAGFALHFTLWQFGVDAAGDAKLFMAIGAFLGWRGMLEATLWRFLLHVPFAVLVLTTQGRWGNFRAAAQWVLLKQQGVDVGERPEPTYMPLGVVIALSVPLAVYTDWLELFG